MSDGLLLHYLMLLPRASDIRNMEPLLFCLACGHAIFAHDVQGCASHKKNDGQWLPCACIVTIDELVGSPDRCTHGTTEKLREEFFALGH